MADLKLAIIGAGPAGCMLARLLHLAGIRVTVFEGEQGIDYRSQGGTLDLHPDSGLKAIHRAGLYPEFLKHVRFDGEALTLVDKNLVKYVKLPGAKEGSSRGRPEIDRRLLRELLIKSVPQECLVWGKRLKRVESDLTLTFEDSSEKGFDLIVGADGAFSKVRPFVSSVDLVYTGVGVYQGSVEDAKYRHPELYRLVNRGSLFALSDHKVLTAQQLGDGSLHVGVWLTQDERRSAKIGAGEATRVAKDTIKHDFSDWVPQLLDYMTESAEGSMIYRPLYMLPVGYSWKHRPGVTLIGDAAHLMTPFAGEGVNVALADAIELADAIIKTDKSRRAQASSSSSNLNREDQFDNGAVLSQNIKDFEINMHKRVTEVAQRTYDAMNAMIFMPGPPRRTMRTWMLTVLGSDVPKIFYPLVFVALYIYFFFHMLLKPLLR